jgi:hypothetical protein
MRIRKIVPLLVLGVVLNIPMPASSHNSGSANFVEKKVVYSTGFRISALAKTNQHKAREPILVDFLIQNVTKKTLTLVETFPERDYEIEAKNSQGELVRLTARGETLRNNKGANFRVVGSKVKPGEQRKDTIDVAQLYDLSAPGVYYLRASRRIQKLNSDSWVGVETNTLTITVVP